MLIRVGDPGAAKAKIYLDGVLQKFCVWANDGTGQIARCKANADGTLFVDPEEDDVSIEVVHGDVRIEMEHVV